jgi:RNA polymerase sigma-70 factor (ECF subfamily)
LSEQEKVDRFERTVLPHAGAAYNLARWLTRNDHDAEDVVQEALLRAFRFFDGFRGGDPRAWVLAVVRHTCYTWLQRNRPLQLVPDFDEEALGLESDEPSPDAALDHEDERARLARGLAGLPVDLREAIVLRELEGLSYKEIAAVTNVPIGTVMSRLSRARDRLHACLTRDDKEVRSGLR